MPCRYNGATRRAEVTFINSARPSHCYTMQVSRPSAIMPFQSARFVAISADRALT